MEHDLPSIKSWKSLVKRRNNPQEGVKASFFFGFVLLGDDVCVIDGSIWCFRLLNFDVGKLLQGKSSWKMKPVIALIFTLLFIFLYKTTNIQYQQTQVIYFVTYIYIYFFFSSSFVMSDNSSNFLLFWYMCCSDRRNRLPLWDGKGNIISTPSSSFFLMFMHCRSKVLILIWSC